MGGWRFVGKAGRCLTRPSINCSGVSHAAIVENKRLGEILAWIKEQQDRQPRFNRVPDGPRRSSQKPGILKDRPMKIVEAAKPKTKSPRVSRRRSDMVVSAAPAHAPSEAAE